MRRFLVLPTEEFKNRFEKLLESPEAPLYRDKSGNTLLHELVSRVEDLKVFIFWGKRLVKAGLDPNIRNSSGLTPAALSLILDKPRFLKPLVAWGSDPNLRDREGRTLLHLACARGAFGAAKFLLEKGAKIDGDYEADHSRNTLLHYAIRARSLKLVELLLDKGANPNSQNLYGETPLYLTLTPSLWKEGALALIRGGADPTDTPLYGKSFLSGLYEAVDLNKTRNQRFLLIKTWLEKAPNTPVESIFVSFTPGWPRVGVPVRTSLVHVSAWVGDWELLEMLLKRGADPNLRDPSGETPLQFLASVAHWSRGDIGRLKKSIDVLIEAGADVDLGPKTALERVSHHISTSNHSKQIFLYLLSKGANPNLGETVFNVFSQREAELFEILFERGADPLLGVCQERTPVDEMLWKNPFLFPAEKRHLLLASLFSGFFPFYHREGVEIVLGDPEMRDIFLELIKKNIERVMQNDPLARGMKLIVDTLSHPIEGIYTHIKELVPFTTGGAIDL